MEIIHLWKSALTRSSLVFACFPDISWGRCLWVMRGKSISSPDSSWFDSTAKTQPELLNRLVFPASEGCLWETAGSCSYTSQPSAGETLLLCRFWVHSLSRRLLSTNLQGNSEVGSWGFVKKLLFSSQRGSREAVLGTPHLHLSPCADQSPVRFLWSMNFRCFTRVLDFFLLYFFCSMLELTWVSCICHHWSLSICHTNNEVI